MIKQDFELTNHAKTMLGERGIMESWLWETLESPDRIEEHLEAKVHYLKAIAENGNRYLRVIVSHGEPKRIVTLYFDRKLRSSK